MKLSEMVDSEHEDYTWQDIGLARRSRGTELKVKKSIWLGRELGNPGNRPAYSASLSAYTDADIPKIDNYEDFILGKTDFPLNIVLNQIYGLKQDVSTFDNLDSSNSLRIDAKFNFSPDFNFYRLSHDYDVRFIVKTAEAGRKKVFVEVEGINPDTDYDTLQDQLVKYLSVFTTVLENKPPYDGEVIGSLMNSNPKVPFNDVVYKNLAGLGKQTE